jgi:hypothetical protein
LIFVGRALARQGFLFNDILIWHYRLLTLIFVGRALARQGFLFNDILIWRYRLVTA